jgi:hypothetical protein
MKALATGATVRNGSPLEPENICGINKPRVDLQAGMQRTARSHAERGLLLAAP